MSARPSETTAPPGDVERPDERRWHLEDQRDFLLRSLDDLRSERAAGDISVADFEALRTRDSDRLSAVEAELAALDAQDAARARTEAEAPAPGSGSDRAGRRRRRWLAVLAVVALSAGSTLLVVHLTAPSLPGQPVTGSTPQTVASELNDAQVLVDEGTRTSLAQALTLYRQVLAADPSQPQALAETGWLEWEAGYEGHAAALEHKGRALVQRSIKVEHNDYGAHLFLANIEFKGDHDATAAVAQFKIFLAEHPPKSEVALAAGVMRQAFAAAGQPLPAGVPGS